MKKVQQGFTLIELMIVVAIIGILAAVAIPAYQDYTIRAKVTEGLGLAAAAKTAVSEYYASQGTLPTNNDEAGMGSAGDYETDVVDTVTVASGVVTIDFKAIGGDTTTADLLSFYPTQNAAGAVMWKCAGRNGGDYSSPTGTNPIANKYLPSNCR